MLRYLNAKLRKHLMVLLSHISQRYLSEIKFLYLILLLVIYFDDIKISENI